MRTDDTAPDPKPAPGPAPVAATKLSRLNSPALPARLRWPLIAAAGLVLAAIISAGALLLAGGDSASPDSSSANGSAIRSEAVDGAADNPAGGQPAGPRVSDPAKPATEGTNDNAPATNVKPPASAVNTNPNDAATITISSDGFSPANLTVAVNSTVTWRNRSGATTAIDKAADATDGPHSPQLSPGSSYSFSYSKPGSFRYVSVTNPQLSGTVTVKD